MPLPIPQIDDVEFEQLFEEAKALIPRYAPEWTDHNFHDPGITILELLAWIVDQQIYQVGFVSDRHLRAFAALLGVRPKAAVPARGLIWPEKLSNNGWKHVVLAEADLPRGEKITCVQHPDIYFVVDADIHLTPANLIHTENGIKASLEKREIDLTQFMQQRRSSFVFQPGNEAEKTLEISFDQPLVRDSKYPIALGIEIDPIAVSAHADAQTPWGPLYFEYQTETNAETSAWKRLQIVVDGTFSLSRTGVVLLKIPAEKQATSSKLRLRLDRGFYPVPIQIIRLEVNVLPIVQLEKHQDTVIGRSNGLPDQGVSVGPVDLSKLPDQTAAWPPLGVKISGKEQTRSSSHVPFPYPLQIAIPEDGQWIKAEDLSKSKPSEHVYRVDTAENRVVFGNGVNGKIPRDDAQILIKACHTTTGAEGNLAAGLDWRAASVPVQGAIFGSNPQPVAGGENAWDIEKLMDEARQRVLERQVMLSDADLVSAVNSLKGFAVARTDVLSRYHPAQPDQEIRGARTVVVTPWRNRNEKTDSVVDARYLKAIASAIEPYRVLGERLKVITHQQVPIRIEATLLIGEGKDSERIKAESVKRLKGRFSDIPTTDENSNPWPLGRPVTVGEIKALLSTIPNVIAVTDCKVARKNEPFAEKDIQLARDEIAIGGEGDFKIIFPQNRSGSSS